ncbi:O-antigen polymerase [Mycolicibacterium sp. XJ879]
MTALGLVAATVALLIAAVRYKHGVLLAVGIGLAIHYTYRSVVLDRSLDYPYPSYLFLSGFEPLFQQIDLLLIVWIIVLLGTTSILRRRRESIGDLKVDRATLLPRLWPIATVVVLSTTLLIVSKGGFAAAQRFVRLGDSGQGGTGIFLVAPAILLVTCVIYFRASLPHSRDRIFSIMGMAMAGSTFLVVGSRTPIIAAFASFLLASLLRMVHRRRVSFRVMAVVIIAAIMLPVFAVGLRAQRDATLTGAPSVELDTSFSEAINATYYDVLALAVRDSGESYPALSPEVFLSQSFAIVPRVIWEGKPEFVSVGKWLRRQYEPWTINGWPPGAPGDWYLALGLVGVIIGALLTGLFANLLDRWSQRIGSNSSSSPNFELALLWGFVLLPGGIDAEIIPRVFIWVLLPLLYIKVFSRRTEKAPLGAPA